MTELPSPAPAPNAETAPFWDATARGVMLLQRCNSCGSTIWYPRWLCPICGSTDTSWYEASGRGSIYSFTVVRRGDGPYREVGPYVLAYVELEEGPRIVTNVLTDDPDAVRVGQAVTVTFTDTGEGTALPRFTPA